MPQREEESLLEEMRATIRADRERAAARGAPANAPTPPAPEPQPAPPPVREPRPPLLRRLLGR